MSENSKQPKYIQVYEKLLEDIENNRYNSSLMLPSENELAKEFCVNRHTVRQSLKLLKEKGVIYSKKGKGYFISNILLSYPITDRSSFTSKILDLGYDPESKLIRAGIVEANSTIAEALGISKKLKVIELVILRCVNDIPLTVSYSYLDAYLYKNIMNHLDIKPFSLYKLLNSAYSDLNTTKDSTIFHSVLSTSEQSDLLMIPYGSPLLSTTTVSKDQEGNKVLFGTAYFRSDICKIKVDLH